MKQHLSAEIRPLQPGIHTRRKMLMQRRQLIRGFLSLAAAGFVPARQIPAGQPASPAAAPISLLPDLLEQFAAQLRKAPLSGRVPDSIIESQALTAEISRRLQTAQPISASLWQNLADSILRTARDARSITPNQQLIPLISQQISLLAT
ncbi:MAG: hypothetical protein RL215_2510 [Planctomycetota bacterium]